MRLGSVEMLRAGVTTSVEMYFFADAVLSAVLDVGSRVVLTPGIIAAPGWDRLGTWEQLRDEVSARIDRDGLRHGPADRIEIGYGPHAAYTLPAEALPSVAEHAKQRGALLHMHVAETKAEDSAQRAKYGSVPAMLDALGVLGGRVLAAHGVQLSDSDIALFARHDVAVAHCPGSNAKLAAGIAPLAALRAAGVRLGLGTDGPASSDDLDLWVVVRLAAQLARLATANAAALTASEVLLLATSGGAAAIGREDIGALEAGRWADLVHVRTDDPAFVALDVDSQLVSNLIWGGSAGLVCDVWVGGEQVLAEGEPVRVDRAEVQSAVRTVAARLR
jgi:5-methylthioadenosine/S-adenosylhomocysteine deaminase